MENQGYITRTNRQAAGLFINKQPTLAHLTIELTSRCNNNCRHCYINLPANDLNAKRSELTTEQWKAILLQAANLGALSICFTGGEPLLREDFVDLYLFTRRLGIKVALFTNARLITPELADLFASIPPLKKIEISVYGIQKETYDAVTSTPGAFDEFQRGLNLLIERQIPFSVKSVLITPNKKEVEEYENWVANLPGDINPKYTMFLGLRTYRDSTAKNEMIKELRIAPHEALAYLTRHKDDYCLEIAQFSEKFMYPQGDELFNCGAGVNGWVDANGKYQLCALVRHPDLVYDLVKGTLGEALKEIFPSWCKARTTNPLYLERCGLCFLKGLCGQCPGKSWSEHGTLDTPVEYLCKVAHAQARFLGLLKEGEQAWEISDWKERIDNLVSNEILIK